MTDPNAAQKHYVRDRMRHYLSGLSALLAMAGDNRALRSERKTITNCTKSLQSALKGKEK